MESATRWIASPKTARHTRIVNEHMKWLTQQQETITTTDFSRAPISEWYDRYVMDRQKVQERVGDVRSVWMKKRKRAERERKARSADKD